MPLDEYWEKRDFQKTNEPRGSHETYSSDDQPLRYVIQMHDASRLHYDFRLEHDGVLHSWAVPKGPSLSPRDRRLAVRTEDHPIEYGDFEGTIPEDEYGGGTVALWDVGTWEPLGHVGIATMMERGKLELTLHGERLNGGWVLIRIKEKTADLGKTWLLIKLEDEHAQADGEALVRTADTSVTSGRTLAQIAQGSSVWHSNKPRAAAARKRNEVAQAATVVAEVGSGRAKLTIEGADVSARYPEIVRALTRVGARATLEGVIVHDEHAVLVVQALRDLDGDPLEGYAPEARRAALGLLLGGSDIDPALVTLADVPAS